MTEDKRQGIDRMEIHYRQQLCALMDGDLPPDEARFLLRRLQHDAELGGCWERWQLIGESLRGRVAAPLPADFSQRVAAAIAAEPVARASATQSPRWARWGGGALAASVALVALFMARQQTPSGVVPGAESAAPIVAAASTPPARAPQPVAPPAPAAADPAPIATLAAATVAVAEVPRRAAANRRASTRSQSQRAALRVARENTELPIVAVAANDTPASTPAAPPSAAALIASKDPFVSQAVAPSRPWPSATLPQLSGTSALSVDYGTGAYYPFQPRTPAHAPPPSGDALQDAEETPQR